MIGIITITNTELNSGTAINLLGNNISFKWEVYTTNQGTPKKDADGTLESGLGRGINTGFNNPEITIQGVFNLDTTHTTGANATIDYEWMEELVRRSDQVMILTNDAFKTTSNTTGAINVMLKGFGGSNSNSNIISYDATFVRVKEE